MTILEQAVSLSSDFVLIYDDFLVLRNSSGISVKLWKNPIPILVSKRKLANMMFNSQLMELRIKDYSNVEVLKTTFHPKEIVVSSTETKLIF